MKRTIPGNRNNEARTAVLQLFVDKTTNYGISMDTAYKLMQQHHRMEYHMVRYYVGELIKEGKIVKHGEQKDARFQIFVPPAEEPLRSPDVEEAPIVIAAPIVEVEPPPPTIMPGQTISLHLLRTPDASGGFSLAASATIVGMDGMQTVQAHGERRNLAAIRALVNTVLGDDDPYLLIERLEADVEEALITAEQESKRADTAEGQLTTTQQELLQEQQRSNDLAATMADMYTTLQSMLSRIERKEPPHGTPGR